MKGLRDGDIHEAIARHVGNEYIQHNAHVRDGKEGFIEYFEKFLERNPKREMEILRGFEDGEYVFVHAYQNLNDGESEWVTMDFFRTDENDKLVEHWDTLSRYAGATNPSGRTKIDGAREVTDLDQTEANKDLVRRLLQDGLMRGGDPSKLSEYISSDQYIQHNPDVGDGLEHFQRLASNPNRPLNYEEVVLLVGQGNFVATLSRATWKDAHKDAEYAQADLFRIENGKVVEHWDNVEKILPRDQWVNSGKF